ncbi:MAG: hypothetical protein A3J83_02040 [Elusimicrobia bacterium RIFOXYA2_FULL_40_6]|nr:MAG: hypothetical protein A3J83_02040 [Elusimicrobia bacterium RIFOXYA2_FULL_40_6]
MKCNKIDEKLLNEYFDNELDERSARNISEHLRDCPVCSEKLAFFKGVSDLIAESPKINAPVGFTTRVISSLPEKITTRAFFPKILELNFKTFSAAAGFLLIFTSLVFYSAKYISHKNANVTFEISLANASVVTLAGDFNGWNMYATPFNEENGVWSVTLPLKKGTYQYSVIVDGKQWYPDPQDEVSITKNTKIIVPTDIEKI